MNKKKQNLRRIDAPIYRYWQALYLAFYSRRLYVDVAKRWRGYGILYLLLVLSIAMVPLSARIIFDFNQYFDEKLIAPLKKLPPLFVQNGQVTFDKPMPYLIKNKNNEIVAIIDTTGTVSNMSKLYPQLLVLITKDKLYFRPPPFETFFTTPSEVVGDNVFEQSLNKEGNEVFVAKDWIASGGILNLKWLIDVLIYPFLTAFIFGGYLIAMIFLAFIGQLFSIIIFKYKLSFKEACRIFMVASTAQVFIFFGLFAAQASLPGRGYSYTALLSIYFCYAVISIRRESNKMVHA